MKHRHGSFFLALVLFTAAPALADTIFFDWGEGHRISDAMQESPHGKALWDVSSGRNFSLNTFKKDEFRIGSNFEFRMSDFTKDDRISNVGMLLHSGSGSDNRPLKWIGFSSKNGDFFGRDDENARWKHTDKNQIDGDTSLSAVAVPEPGSQTLLLFGLAGLGMIVYRRNSLKNPLQQ